MSFLEALNAKRHKLRNCETIVTTTTGERYVESSRTQEKRKLQQPNTYGFVVDTKPDLIPACILDDFLYLGSQDAATLENIQKYKLTHILSAGIECPLQDAPENISILHVICLDLPESSLTDNGILEKSFDFIERARSVNGRILVHCNAGVSRSSSIIIAYLMRYHQMNFERSYKHVKDRRECIQPNVGFMKQLRNFK